MNAPIQGTVYPVLPLRDIVVFPGMIVPLFLHARAAARFVKLAWQFDAEVTVAQERHQRSPAARSWA